MRKNLRNKNRQLKASNFALVCSILRNGKSSYGKVFPGSIAEKLQRGSFFARMFSLKIPSKKKSGLSMFSVIGKLRVRKNSFTRAGECVQRL